MDEFFRQHDPQYAAEHPEEHAAKEEIYEKLMAGRISALDEKLAALGQTQEDYLPSEIEKFKDATGYEEFLDVDPQAIREAIENPEQSHVDEMLSFAEQANREYEAELYGQQAAPTPDDRETGETVRTPRGTFHVTDMSQEQMEAAGYGFHHESEDGKYLIMANGSRAFAIPSGAAPEHTPPEKLTVLVVEPMKEPYVKEIAPGLHRPHQFTHFIFLRNMLRLLFKMLFPNAVRRVKRNDVIFLGILQYRGNRLKVLLHRGFLDAVSTTPRTLAQFLAHFL